MEKLKKYITLKNILYTFIILCPILDIASFIFRNELKTTISVSTFLRPIIPTVLFIYIFMKEKLEKKLRILCAGIIYLAYAVIHLIIYKQVLAGCSYSGVIHEAQYLLNYSFVILVLYTFIKILYKKEYDNLKYIVISTMAIYVFSIYISIITKTSSSTYIEGLGDKGWFESANSISSILVLLLTIVLSQITKIKSTKVQVGTLILLGITVTYLVLLIGTRVGLYGCVLVLFVYVLIRLTFNFIVLKRINYKYVVGFLVIIILLGCAVFIFGSKTLERRRHLQDIEGNIVDETTQQISHVTGDITKLRERILNNEIDNTYMSNAQKQSILDLYDYANKIELVNNDTRMQQLIYNIYLIKNQGDLILILFGNGYLANTNELIFEMELPAILFNFGIVGFVLYMLPFIAIAMYSIISIIKKIKNVDSETLMLLVAEGLSFVFSTLAGYTFFNISSATIIVVCNVLLLNKIYKIRGEND